mgnify:CR=1 FL=1
MTFLSVLVSLVLPLVALAANPLNFEGEKHLANVKQLTFGGDNAEAYFDKDGKWVVYQSTRDSFQCDQIFIMDTDGKNHHLVSTGRGELVPLHGKAAF